jgi:transcription initiation factor TFIID subunit TAF12
MEFTKIELEQPVVVEAVAEKTYDKQWLAQVIIDASKVNTAKVTAVLVPYDGENIIKQPQDRVTINNIFEAMQDENRPVELRTMYAQVMELLLQTVKAEKAYQKEVARLAEEARLEAERLAEEQRLLEEQNVEENITEEDTTDEEPTPEL